MPDPKHIRSTWPRGTVTAVLNDTPTSGTLLAALPCEFRAGTRGDEVYFSVSVKAVLENDAKQVVDPGTVCFWVEGSSLALPFGATPVFKGNECRLLVRVNIVGKIEGGAKKLKSVQTGDRVRLESAA